MLASSFFDPVLGLDVHFEMVPTPAPVPTPIPNPFIGIVFDPLGLAAGIALGAAIGAVVGAPFQGPVLYWTAFPATNTGTEAKHVPGHILIPPGVSWAPFPKTPKPVIHPGETPKPALPVVPENDAVVIFGSKTVSVMGSNAVRLGDIALSCSEPLRLPSSVVLAVPKSAPILIGGPPSLDLMAAVMASLRTRFVSDSLHALVSRLKPSRFRNLLHKGVCFLTGHPVDVASGKVITGFVDAHLPGPLPLTIERNYSSAFADRDGPIGHGWSVSIDQAIWRERGKVVFLAEDGREIEFDTFDFPGHQIAAGQEVYNPIERLTLRCLADERWLLVNHEGRHREFAPVPGRGDGRAMIQRERSRCGSHENQYFYDQWGRLEWIRDCGGRLIYLSYDAHGRLAELGLPKPQGEGLYRHRRFSYDSAGDLVAVEDSLGHSWRFEYVTHLLTRERDRVGHSYYFAYDGIGEDAWCVRTWGDDGIHDHEIAYDKQNHATFVTNSLGHTTQYNMNVAGQVVEVIDPLGGKTGYEYDPVTLALVSSHDPAGNDTTFEHDRRGRVVLERRPDGGEIRWQYDGSGDLVRQTSAIGATWERGYDQHGRVSIERLPDGGLRQFFHEDGLLAAFVDERGRRTSITYSEHRLPRSLSSDGRLLEQVSYDNLGRIVEQADSHGVVTRVQRNTEGHVVRVHLRDGFHAEFKYDAEGRLVETDDTYGQTLLEYYAHGRLRARRRGQGRMDYRYDSEAQLVEIQDAQGQQYQFALDERGYVKRERDFAGHEHHYTRDANGRALVRRSPGGHAASYSYDPCGRVLEVRHADGSAATFRYRADGELIEAANAVRKVEFERDLMGRITCERQDGVSIESNYDLAGVRVATRSSHGLHTRISADAFGHLKQLEIVTDEHDWRLQFEHDAEGNELHRVLPGGVRIQWQRDDAGRPLRQTAWTDRALLHDRNYVWGPDDRLLAFHDAWRGRTDFEHDLEGNLVRAVSDRGESTWRNPDAVGNLYRSEDRSDRDYGPQGQLRRARTDRGTIDYSHGEDGRLTRRRQPDGSEWCYEYDGAGQLTRVVRPDGRTIELNYDALGRRVSCKSDEREVVWFWDGNLPVHEVDADGRVTTWIFDASAGFAPIARVCDRSFAAVVSDHRGTPQALVDDAGELRWSGYIGPDGDAEITHADLRCPFRHAGQYYDEELELSYNRFRYYDPEAGQYTTPDPLRSVGGLLLSPYVRVREFGRNSVHDLTSSSSLYAYVGDPMIWVDPFGLVRIHTEGGVEVNAYPGPPAGGIEHKPLHAHVTGSNQGRETRVLMEDWFDNGRLKGSRGEVYPGDPALSKRARKIIRNNLDDLARKTDEVFNTGGCS